MRHLITSVLLTICLTATGQNFYSESIYNHPSGKNVIIENSLPKGGIKYTAPSGEEYVYAVFWTRITNETASPLELKISFPADPFSIPFTPDNSFKLLLPPEVMSLEKEALFNYGLTDLETFLDNNHNKKSDLQRTIDPQESYLFYVAALYDKGVNGNVRAGFTLKNKELFYKISGREIPCGQIVF